METYINNKMTYKEHLDFIRISNSAKWFKNFEAFHKAFMSYDERILIKAWEKAKGVNYE